MSEITKFYPIGDFKVVWKLQLCRLAAEYVKALPKAYNQNDKPWIKPENATEQELIDQINRCPSGALTFKKI